MATIHPTSITQAERRGRIAVAALFLANGALFANLVPRYPELKATLGLSNTAYGVSIAAFPVGAIVAGLTAGALIRRFGSARVAVFTSVLTGASILGAGSARSVWWFAAALFLAGALDAITDVAQNSNALAVQRRYGRSIINSLHAVWSAGAVLGGAMAATALGLRLGVGVHLGISAVLFGAVALAAWRFCLDDDAPHTAPQSHAGRQAGPVPARVLWALAALVGIATAGAVVEDAGSSWATMYVGSLGAAPSVAATGFIALVGAQFIGRLVGDRLVDRFGQRTVAQSGAIFAAAGMGAALLYPTVPVAIVGFAAAGFGVATLVPAAMHEADELPGLRHGTGLTVVSWLMRLGFLCSPPIVGALADGYGLRAALWVVPIVAVLVVALAMALGGKREKVHG